MYDDAVLNLYANNYPNSMTDEGTMAVVKQLLEATDWMGLSDTPTMTTAWATYRATLRNLENSSNWPVLNLEEWPEIPT